MSNSDMHQTIKLALLLVMWFPKTGQAAETCDVIEALERVQFSQIRLSQAPQLSRSPDWRLIADNLKRLDRNNIKNAVQSNRSQTEIAVLQAYYATALRLNSNAKAGQWDAVASYFASQTFRDTQNQIRTILPRFGCNTTQSQGDQGTSRQGQSTSKIIKSNVNLSIQGTIWMLLGTLALCLVVGWGTMQYNRFRRAQRRRAKRYPTSIKTQMRLGNSNLLAVTVIDISGKGVKLKIHSDDSHKTGTQMHVLLDGTWHKGQIVWQNTHYCGINFVKPLKRQTVYALCSSPPANGTIKAKTAPT